MHTYTTASARFHYNSDLSGRVKISTDEGTFEVSGAALLVFVAHAFIAPSLISRVECMSTEELLRTKDALPEEE